METVTEFSTIRKFRKNIRPKNVQDLFFTTFGLLITPTVYWFEIFVVLPKTYPDESETVWPIIHCTLGTFILLNIIGNLLALILLDTSISCVILQPKSDWKLCSTCETLVPPRSWHCRECDVCVLKRDHHCSFCSNCIGYHNQRYFIHFLIYVFVATAYSSFFNMFFVYEISDFNSWMAFVSVLFPLAMLVFNYSVKQFYMMLTLIIVIMCVYSGCLLYFHLKLVFKGVVTHERVDAEVYNLGWTGNLQQVFGRSWKIAWISPLFLSPLPGDGQHFKVTRKEQ